MTEPDHPDTADVYLTNATQCSAGTGPGSATLPWGEAKALVDAGLASYGTPPDNSLAGPKTHYPAVTSASNQSPPTEPAPDDGPVMDVFLVVAVMTSGGAGPGAVSVPAAEAARLVKAKLAIGGSVPPRGWNLEV